jgi:hypothetical protein
MYKWVLGLMVLGSGIAAGVALGGRTAGKWDVVLRELGSADFAARDAGQQSLERARAADHDELARLAAGASDAEVKARLQARVTELEEEAATDPPPISMEVEDASCQEMLAALNKAVGGTIVVPKFFGQRAMGRSPGDDHYTLKATKQSFWSVFLSLSNQHEFGLSPQFGKGIVPEGTGVKAGIQRGPFLFYVLSIEGKQHIDMQPPSDVDVKSLTLEYGIAVDPRVQILASVQPELLSVVDDQGRELIPPRDPRARDMWGREERPNFLFRQNAMLRVVPGGKRIVSAKGMMRLIVAVSERRVELADIAKQVGKPVDMEGHRFVMKQFGLRGGSPYGEGILEGEDHAGHVDPRRDFGVTMTLYSADERPAHISHLEGRWSALLDGFKEPVRAVFTVPTRTKEIDVPFEFKDLPLP